MSAPKKKWKVTVYKPATTAGHFFVLNERLFTQAEWDAYALGAANAGCWRPSEILSYQDHRGVRLNDCILVRVAL